MIATASTSTDTSVSRSVNLRSPRPLSLLPLVAALLAPLFRGAPLLGVDRHQVVAVGGRAVRG